MRILHGLWPGISALALLAPTGAGGQEPAPPETKLPAFEISAAFDYEVESVMARGIRVAYVDEGIGPPVVFIHGNPTSKYLWRNVIPHVTGEARAIALDLPGMGESEKPRPALGFLAQVDVFAAFVDALELDDITLVVHDWGAAIGFDYARTHPDRVRAIAFMEGVLPPSFPVPSFEAMGPEIGPMFRAFKDPVQGPKIAIEDNMFIEQVLPGFVNRSLTEEEMRTYRRPFLDAADRGAILQWPREIPIGGEPADVVARMEVLAAFMQSTELPLLLLYADPGVVVPPEARAWYEANLEDLETAFVGQSLHFIQEDQPHAVGRAIRDWMRRRLWSGDR